MSRQFFAVGSDPVAAAAANEVLSRGNAVDAVVAGVLAAAGEHASVLLGPVQIVVAGPGVGMRAVDGRSRQPGKGAPRPRGFVEGEHVPSAARAAVPALPVALAAALSSFGKLTSAAVYAAGIARASKVPERKALLTRLSQRGPSALADEQVAGELVAAVGRGAGGVLTAEDLAEVRPAVLGCVTTTVGTRRIATVPWGAAAVREGGAPAVSAAGVEAVVAADIRGVLAAACYVRTEEGALIEPLGLVAPPVAVPVLRGTPRVRPGEALPAAAPIAIFGSADAEAVDSAFAAVRAEDAEHALFNLARAVAEGTTFVAAARNAAARVLGVAAEAGQVTSIE